jgi:membrane-associated protease RseP (regulator of RpoE activity)
MPKRSAIVQPVLLATSLAIGAGTVWAAVVIWCETLGHELFPRDYVSESVVYRLDGTPLIYRREGEFYYRIEDYRTLDGESIPRDEIRSQVHAYPLYGPPPGRMHVAQLDWWDRLLGYTDRRQPPTLWYFVHTGRREGRGYFVGYDSDTKSRVGYIARGGFRRHPPRAEDCFPVDARRLGYRNSYGAVSRHRYLGGREPYWYSSPETPGPGEIPESTVHLITGDRLVEVDLQQRSVREVLASPGLVSVAIGRRALAELPPKDPETFPQFTQSVLLRMEDRVVVLDALGGERREYLIPSPLRSRDFDFLELADGRAIATASDPVVRGYRPTSLYWFDRSGEILRREDLRLRTSERDPGPTAKALLMALNLPAPIATIVEASVFEPRRRLLSMGKASSYSEALAKTWSYAWLAVTLNFLIGIGLSWFCRRWQREHAASWTGVWMAFAILFGAPGLVGYLVHRAWAARPACPSCGQRAPRDRGACATCGTEFPEPAPQGIEVFA